MRLLRSVLLASSCLLSSVSAADSDVDGAASSARGLDQRKYNDSFEVIKTTSAEVETYNKDLSELGRPGSLIHLLCSVDNFNDKSTGVKNNSIKWILALRNDPHPHLVSWFINGAEKEESYVGLSYKILSEIKSMCDASVDGTWTIDSFKVNYYWRGCVRWSDLDNSSIKFKRLIKMGVEIETSVIKIRPGKGATTYQMDVFTSKQAPWSFTSDTLDDSLKSSGAQWMNTESKTISGLSNEEVLCAVNEMGITIRALLIMCKYNETDLHQKDIPFCVRWNESYAKASIWAPFNSEKQKLRLAYPQITYSLPLELLPNIFQRLVLLGLGSQNIPYEKTSDLERFTRRAKPSLSEDFCKSNDLELENLRNRTSNLAKKYRISIELNHRMQTMLLDSIHTIFERSISGLPSHGLGYLFSFYVYQLFCNNLYIKEIEPGPKLKLTVMSRIPFSSMYDCLSQQEQEKFRNLVEMCFKQFFQNKLVSYKTTTFVQGKYIDLQENERITLEQWYQSIISSDEKPDLLSPPPGCHECNPAYGMGAYNSKSTHPGNALVEVRGYSKLKINEQAITIDNVEKIIKDEARWFFSF